MNKIKLMAFGLMMSTAYIEVAAMHNLAHKTEDSRKSGSYIIERVSYGHSEDEFGVKRSDLFGEDMEFKNLPYQPATETMWQKTKKWGIPAVQVGGGLGLVGIALASRLSGKGLGIIAKDIAKFAEKESSSIAKENLHKLNSFSNAWALGFKAAALTSGIAGAYNMYSGLGKIYHNLYPNPKHIKMAKVPQLGQSNSIVHSFEHRRSNSFFENEGPRKTTGIRHEEPSFVDFPPVAPGSLIEKEIESMRRDGDYAGIYRLRSSLARTKNL